jgi:uncharacterized Ntn-hydrolase superfamily protein
MKHTVRHVIVLLALAITGGLQAQDTFSIVAVDPETGQVGSAGATCLDSVLEGTSAVIVSYIKPGVGAIHTQSFWNPINQANASARMEAGDSPEEIMAWLEANDAEGNPAIRQYGAADLDAGGLARVAAFTGEDCFDYKGHELGPNYAVQGNILSGRAILDSMSERFFFESGDLADKLMASMQGAKKVGADTRCFAAGVSSRSAFLRVAKPTDSITYYLDIVVGSTPSGVDPIDVLQQKFDAWRAENPYEPPVSGLGQAFPKLAELQVFPNPAGLHSRLAALDPQTWIPGVDKGSLMLQLTSVDGKIRWELPWDGSACSLAQLLERSKPMSGSHHEQVPRQPHGETETPPAGLYTLRAFAGQTAIAQSRFVFQP